MYAEIISVRFSFVVVSQKILIMHYLRIRIKQMDIHILVEMKKDGILYVNITFVSITQTTTVGPYLAFLSKQCSMFNLVIMKLIHLFATD